MMIIVWCDVCMVVGHGNENGWVTPKKKTWFVWQMEETCQKRKYTTSTLWTKVSFSFSHSTFVTRTLTCSNFPLIPHHILSHVFLPLAWKSIFCGRESTFFFFWITKSISGSSGGGTTTATVTRTTTATSTTTTSTACSDLTQKPADFGSAGKYA